VSLHFRRWPMSFDALQQLSALQRLEVLFQTGFCGYYYTPSLCPIRYQLSSPCLRRTPPRSTAAVASTVGSVAEAEGVVPGLLRSNRRDCTVFNDQATLRSVLKLHWKDLSSELQALPEVLAAVMPVDECLPSYLACEEEDDTSDSTYSLSVYDTTDETAE
jgi:hypothetical protein